MPINRAAARAGDKCGVLAGKHNDLGGRRVSMEKILLIVRQSNGSRLNVIEIMDPLQSGASSYYEGVIASDSDDSFSAHRRCCTVALKYTPYTTSITDIFRRRNFNSNSNLFGRHHERFYSQSSLLWVNKEKYIVHGNNDNNASNNNASVARKRSNTLQADALSSKQGEVTTRKSIDINSSTQQQKRSIDNTIISYLTSSIHPYARLARIDKPIGTFLLLHPCLWSTALATSTPVAAGQSSMTATLSLCALFGAGSFVMRSAGCTINDMWDSQYDRDVKRTKSRPLASGELTHAQALKFLGLQLSAGLGVLLSLPHVEQCFVWGAASLPLVATYPLMKRYTNYPQLVLGLTFNWGAIMGWVAVHGTIDWSVVGPLYGSGVAWTLVYDTLYAHQDKMDDAKLGLKSTALTFGKHGTKPILTGCAVVAWGGWTMAGYNCGLGNLMEAPYYYAGVSAAGAHLLWQVHSAELNDVENLAYRFRSNNVVGWIVFGSCIAGNIMPG
jgi:4-hydroxybenzoate polyprenyltransferase